MILNYLIAFGAIMIMLVAWIGVQHAARWYSLRHPEFGRAREEGAGCGTGCRCKGGSTCTRD